MEITKYGHSCVRLADGGRVLVIDPGELSEPEALDGADAVLVTHEHPDHMDLGRLRSAAAQRPELVVYTNPVAAAALTDLKCSVEVAEPGSRITAAGFAVRVYGGQHALIHPELPRVVNLAYYLEDASLYHPGDSFDLPTDDVAIETLFVPIAGSWLRLTDAVDFVRRIAPLRAFPLHDALLSEPGHAVMTANMRRLVGCPYERLHPGTVL